MRRRARMIGAAALGVALLTGGCPLVAPPATPPDAQPDADPMMMNPPADPQGMGPPATDPPPMSVAFDSFVLNLLASTDETSQPVSLDGINFTNLDEQASFQQVFDGLE